MTRSADAIFAETIDEQDLDFIKEVSGDYWQDVAQLVIDYHVAGLNTGAHKAGKFLLEPCPCNGTTEVKHGIESCVLCGARWAFKE